MLRRSSVVHVVDELARAQRRERAREELGAFLVGALWTLWGVRLELALVAVAAVLQRAGSVVLGDVGGLVVVALGVPGVLVARPARGFLFRLLRVMRVRRAWARATIDCGVAAGPFRCPGVW